MKIKNRNLINQTFAQVAGVKEPKTLRVGRETTLKFSAAAQRALDKVPVKDRDKVAKAAAELAEQDPRLILNMVWDCHVAPCFPAVVKDGETVKVTLARPGVAVESEIAAWRKALGLPTPSRPSPKAAAENAA
jgi:hypothetical protein